ncbi:hypothetical protein HZH66_007108 [Vespula vulgaris]|uniref:Uncharacterized protein n=2 Tax=Vespula TaxID=7451 RepID=A0A834U959_VESPE|nr:hypothetical protein HZH66_007108 [Vespula vulgaris]KAF7423229.1 hypothetical protein H0235_008512 [Vespula pensylvanica]
MHESAWRSLALPTKTLMYVHFQRQKGSTPRSEIPCFVWQGSPEEPPHNDRKFAAYASYTVSNGDDRAIECTNDLAK